MIKFKNKEAISVYFKGRTIIQMYYKNKLVWPDVEGNLACFNNALNSWNDDLPWLDDIPWID